jgi:hypothetical protein
MEQLLENARNEINKLKNPNKEEIMDNAIVYADNVLKRLVAHTLDVDVKSVFDEQLSTIGSILIDDGKDRYLLQLDIVEHDYVLDLLHFANRSDVKERIVFLLNTVKVLYCPIRDYMRTKCEFNYVLQIGLNTTLFLDHTSKNRIGITLTKL